MGEVLDRSPPRLGREFVGLARQFKGGVGVEDVQFDEVLAGLLKPLQARLRHHPRLRHDMLAQFDQLYRSTVPTKFRVGDVVIDKDRAKFRCGEAEAGTNADLAGFPCLTRAG